jgi:hypothetical protein
MCIGNQTSERYHIVMTCELADNGVSEGLLVSSAITLTQYKNKVKAGIRVREVNPWLLT